MDQHFCKFGYAKLGPAFDLVQESFSFDQFWRSVSFSMQISEAMWQIFLKMGARFLKNGYGFSPKCAQKFGKTGTEY